MKMRKKLLSLVMAAAIAITGIGIAGMNNHVVKAEEKTPHPNTTIASIPYFNSIYGLVTYADNADTGEYNCTVQEMLSYSNNFGYGGTHTLTIPEDGTLIFYTLSKEKICVGQVYKDSELKERIVDNSCESTRGEPTKYEVKKGTTYYFRQEYSGEEDNILTTTYMGLIPSSASATCIIPTAKYNESNNSEVKVVGSVQEFKMAAASMTGITSTVTDVITRVSDVYSFTVKEPGWLLSYAIPQLSSIKQYIYSDKSLGSLIAKVSNKSLDEEPAKVWLDAGTYYWRSEGYNYNKETTLKSYLGFIPASRYITAGAPVFGADGNSATVTFTTPTTGVIKVVSGYPLPSLIDNEEFWKSGNGSTLVVNNTYTAPVKGDYVARFEDSVTGMHYMIPFSTTGSGQKSVTTGTSVSDASKTQSGKKDIPGKVTIKKAKNIKGGKIQVKLKAVKGATGYKVSYATNKKFKKAITKKFKKTTYVIKKLKKKKTYYVRVCAYNKAGTGKWSKTVKVKIRA